MDMRDAIFMVLTRHTDSIEHAFGGIMDVLLDVVRYLAHDIFAV